MVSGFVLLLVAGVRHLRWREHFTEQLRAQGLWPERAVPTVAAAVTSLELLIGAAGLVLLGLGASARTLTVPLLVLLVAGLGFTTVQIVLAVRAPDAPCGCDPSHDDPVSELTVVKAGWPALCAAVGLLALPADGLDQVWPAVVGLVLAVAVDLLPALGRRLAQR